MPTSMPTPCSAYHVSCAAGRGTRLPNCSHRSCPSPPVAEPARELLGVRTAVGVPARVEGRLWGIVSIASRRAPLPAGTEARLAGFTELAATAVANAEARAEVTASRARIVAAADQARRRIEQDLHDGAQGRW